MITLRPYQQKFVGDLRSAFAAGAKRVLGVSPTGSGKSACMAHIARCSLEKGLRTTVIAHRAEIIKQLSDALRKEGVDHGIIRSGVQMRAHMPVQVASVQTLVKRMSILPKPDMLMVDESHRIMANTYLEVLSAYSHAKVLGVTATPERLDGKGLGDVFNAMVRGPEVQWLIDNGFLARPIYYAPKTVDASGVSMRAGDYAKNELASLMDKPSIIGDSVAHYRKYADGKTAIAFCVNLKHARDTADAFNAVGIKAEVIDGTMDDSQRTGIVERVRTGVTKILTSCELIGEGFDAPAVGAGILLRPTASLGLHLQQCLDSKTEILSDSGWVGVDEFRESQKVAAFDHNSGLVEWCDVDGFVKRKTAVGEKMISIASPHLDFRVTDGHDMIFKSASATSKNWIKDTSGELALRRSMFHVPVSGVLKKERCGLSDDELRFVGWFLTDGTFNKKSRQVSISQSARKMFHLEHIRKTLSGCGLKFGEYRIKRTGEFTHCADNVMFCVSVGKPRGTGKHLRGCQDLMQWLDKSVGPIFDTLSEEDLEPLIEAMFLGDGWNSTNAITWKRGTFQITCGNNEIMADRLQSIFVTRGYRCNKSIFIGRNGVKWHSLYFRKTNHASVAGSNVKDGVIEGKPYKRSRLSVSDSDGETVWCVTNRLGSIFIRRNGKVCIVGNCGRALRAKPDGSGAIILDHVGNCCRHGLAEEQRDWSLEGASAKRRKREVEIETRRCEECYAVYTGVTCPQCGVVRESKQREIEIREGELQQLEAKKLMEHRAMIIENAKCRSFQDYQALAKKRGYKNGWAYHRWKMSKWNPKSKSGMTVETNETVGLL